MVQACEIHGFINRVTNTDQPTQGQGEFGSQWGWQNFMKSVLCAKSEMLQPNLKSSSMQFAGIPQPRWAREWSGKWRRKSATRQARSKTTP